MAVLGRRMRERSEPRKATTDVVSSELRVGRGRGRCPQSCPLRYPLNDYISIKNDNSDIVFRHNCILVDN
jgi:hypothetical protein